MISDIYNAVISETACASECVYNTRIQEKIDILKADIFNKTISLKFGFCFENNHFNIQRIGRIEPKRTLLIVQQFAYNLSRSGADPVSAI